jgi:ubiquinone/menaquinone biosynthesis C-methylase UbiE
MTSVLARALATVAGQLGNPHGILGKGVAVMLNRANRYMIGTAVDLAAVAPGEAAADIGFGGGVGLSLLLDKVGPTGTVHGVELSRDMVARAKSRFTRDIGAGRLRVLEGSLTGLPLADAGLDAVITVNTVYFVPELDRACAELARVLRPQGRVVVAIGDPEDMAKLPFTRQGFRLRPVTQVREALERAGLVVEHSTRDRAPVAGHFLIGRPA